MAAATVALPAYIHDDAPTQSLMDELRRLEGARAQVQAAHRRRASDDTAVMLQYYGMELEEVGFIIRDRLLALTLGRGEDADGGQVQGIFTALTTQFHAQSEGEGEATAPYDLADELDEVDIAALAALDLESDNEWPVNNYIVHVSAPASPVETPAPLPEPPAILPVVVDSPAAFPAVVMDTLLEA